MKKLWIIILGFLILLSSCQKDELTTDEYIYCKEEYDKIVQQHTKLLEYGLIDYDKLQEYLEQDMKEYEHCIKDASNNK